MEGEARQARENRIDVAVAFGAFSGLRQFVARIEKLERFGAELRRRVRELVAYVEGRAPR